MATLLSALIAPTAAVPVLTLDEAVQTAREHQPQLRQAYASAEAARAVADEARAPLLPQAVQLSTARAQLIQALGRGGN